MVHPCNECDSSFREKKNLQEHMKKRHGLKKYKCGYCNDRLDNRTSRTRHEKKKHENALFKCEQCEYSSPRKDRLRQHMGQITQPQHRIAAAGENRDIGPFRKGPV